MDRDCHRTDSAFARCSTFARNPERAAANPGLHGAKAVITMSPQLTPEQGHILAQPQYRVWLPVTP